MQRYHVNFPSYSSARATFLQLSLYQLTKPNFTTPKTAMANTGRPRGRKSHRTGSHQVSSQPTPHQQMALVNRNKGYAHPVYANPVYVKSILAPPLPHNHPRINEEATAHDDADLIMFRLDALSRFVNNHEFIENITTKRIHTRDVVPPPLFPALEVKPGEEVKPTDVYFGDLAEMKRQEQKLALTVAEPLDDAYLVAQDPQYVYQREMTTTLAETSPDALEAQLDTVLTEYKTKFNREYVAQYTPKRYLATIVTDVDEAPSDYDPKDVKINEKFNGELFGEFNNFDGGNDIDDMFKPPPLEMGQMPMNQMPLNQQMPMNQQHSINAANMPMAANGGTPSMAMGTPMSNASNIDQGGLMGDLINFDGDMGAFDDADFLNSMN